jgi:tight adherence protein B
VITFAWVAGLVAAAAALLAVVLPLQVRRARWRRMARHLGRADHGRTAPAADAGTRTDRWDRLARLGPAGSRRVVAVAAVVSGGAALPAGGPVAMAVGGTYAAVGMAALARSARARSAARAFDRAVDGVATLAAELRAGVPAETAVRDCAPELTDAVAVRVAAAVTLAERTGAPLAAVLDRLDQQLRAALRLRATVTAQAAGARSSAWLLALLPCAGVALGPLMGVSPAAVLLHTPLGAGCLAAAVILQLGGLAWAGRLAGPRDPGVLR